MLRIQLKGKGIEHMIIRLKILIMSVSGSFVILLALCLGSQNLNNRYSLDFGVAKSAPLPIGFIVGVSLITGIISGGSLTALLIEEEIND